MIVFILLLIKIFISLSLDVSLVPFSIVSIPMLIVWMTDPSSAEFFAFKSDFYAVVFLMYLLIWIVTPWLTISKNSYAATVGLFFVIGLSMLDLFTGIICDFSLLQKVLCVLFNTSITLLSIWTMRRKVRL